MGSGGVFSGTWLQGAGSLGAIIAFLIGGVLVVFVGLTYSELVSAMPKAGGEYNYAWRALGAGGVFVASWAIALGYVSVVAFEAVALPTTMEYLLPEGYQAGFLWHSGLRHNGRSLLYRGYHWCRIRLEPVGVEGYGTRRGVGDGEPVR